MSYSSAANPILAEKLQNYLQDAGEVLNRLLVYNKNTFASLLGEDMDRVQAIAASAQLELVLQEAYFDLRGYLKEVEKARVELHLQEAEKSIYSLLAGLKRYKSPLSEELDEALAGGLTTGLKSMTDLVSVEANLWRFRQELRRLDRLANQVVDPVVGMFDKMDVK
jgi:hypothetical protein